MIFITKISLQQLTPVLSHTSLVVVVFIDIKCNKRAERTRKEKHCCQIAKIQQTHIKVQTHKITITKRNSN